MVHLPWVSNYGFGQQIQHVESRIVRAKIIHNDGEILPESEIIRKLGDSIINDICSAKIMRITSNRRLEDFSIEYTAELNVAPLGTKIMNVHSDVFTIDREHFNEHEIVCALKTAYPERFI